MHYNTEKSCPTSGCQPQLDRIEKNTEETRGSVKNLPKFIKSSGLLSIAVSACVAMVIFFATPDVGEIVKTALMEPHSTEQSSEVAASQTVLPVTETAAVDRKENVSARGATASADNGKKTTEVNPVAEATKTAPVVTKETPKVETVKVDQPKGAKFSSLSSEGDRYPTLRSRAAVLAADMEKTKVNADHNELNKIETLAFRLNLAKSMVDLASELRTFSASDGGHDISKYLNIAGNLQKYQDAYDSAASKYR